MNPINTDWSKTTKYLVGVGLTLFGIYVLYLSREVIPLLITAALIAVITRPVITWLHMKMHLARGLAVAIVYLGVAIPAVVNAGHYALTLDYFGFLRMVILLYLLGQQLENTLIVPWVLGGAVGLPPLVVMTEVLVGATTFGLLNALLGKDPFPPGQPVLEHERQPATRLHQLLRSWAQQLARSRMPVRDKPVEDHPQRQSSDPEGKAFPHRK